MKIDLEKERQLKLDYAVKVKECMNTITDLKVKMYKQRKEHIEELTDEKKKYTALEKVKAPINHLTVNLSHHSIGL